MKGLSTIMYDFLSHVYNPVCLLATYVAAYQGY